jgi:hypothetical protein
MGSRDEIMKYICLCLSFFLLACAQAGGNTEMKQPIPLQDNQGPMLTTGLFLAY